MPLDTPTHSDSQNNRLADVLDRLAGVLEQQARGLEELKADVRALAESVKRVETRLEGLDRSGPPTAPMGDPKTAPARTPAKKRGK
jgi:hypothetical protein